MTRVPEWMLDQYRRSQSDLDRPIPIRKGNGFWEYTTKRQEEIAARARVRQEYLESVSGR